MRTACRTALLLLVLLSTASAGMASEPVVGVKQLNGRVFGGYEYDRTQRASQVVGGSSVFLPTTAESRWAVGGVVTAPLWRALGGRVLVAGGGTRVDRWAGPGFVGSDTDVNRIDTGVQAFVRNPELGHLDLGYRFRWESPSDAAVDRVTENGVTLDGGFYVPDQGIGPLDWDFLFDYARSSLQGPILSEDANEYRAGFSLGWYLTPDWRLAGGFLWEMSDPDVSLSSRDIRGTAELSWLLPWGLEGRKLVSANLYASGGSVHTDLAPPFSSVDRGAFSVGASLTVSYPGATSLIELTRELH